VQVFKTSTRFLGHAPDDTLIRMFADLKRRNIALAAEALMLTATARCGAGIEGYSTRQAIEMVASRVRRLGGDLRYVAMDEPLGFGHYSRLTNACRSSVAEVAGDVAENVRTIRRIFPAVRIGDIEAVGHPDSQGDIDALMEWTRAYEAAVGAPLDFLHADVLWTGPWQPQIAQLASRLRAAGIAFGIIYNGNPDDQSDQAWTRHAEQRFAAIEADPALTPDHAVLQTWMSHPVHMLPETQPGTMTWLVNRYRTAQTRLALHRTGARLQGELTDAAGLPLAAAPVSLSAELSDDPGAAVAHTRAGEVPPQAASAVLALRINTECGCSGPADIAIGRMRYRDDRTGQVVQRAFRPPAAPGAPPRRPPSRPRPDRRSRRTRRASRSRRATRSPCRCRCARTCPPPAAATWRWCSSTAAVRRSAASASRSSPPVLAAARPCHAAHRRRLPRRLPGRCAAPRRICDAAIGHPPALSPNAPGRDKLAARPRGSAMTDMLQGGCACGRLRYRMRSAPMFVHCCHCKDCQRQTGTGFVLNALIEAARVELLSGETRPFAMPTDSGRPHTVFRCPDCGTAVWSEYGGLAALRFVRVGTLDDPRALPPDVHIYVRSKLPWITLPDDVPAFEAYYDSRKLWPATSLERRKAILG
jgi:hypothetical protein